MTTAMNALGRFENLGVSFNPLPKCLGTWVGTQVPQVPVPQVRSRLSTISRS